MNFAKTLRAWMLVLFVTASVGGRPVRAQEPPKPPKQSQPAQPPQQSPSNKESDQGFHPSAELARDTREAAGEEPEKDQTETFKHSPSVIWISKRLGIDKNTAYWFSDLLNFAVIAGIIFWAAKKYLPGAFRDRTAAIQKAMQEAQQASEEARRKLVDIEGRLLRLDSEIDAMRAAAEKDGAEEEARIKAAAQQDAQKIVAAAEQEIAAAAKAARRQLTVHAADLAVSLAQKQIRVDAATDQALVRSFAGQMGAAENTGKDGR